MDFDVKIRHGIGGDIEIIDLSRTCGSYLDESENRFGEESSEIALKYSDSATVNILTKVTTDSVEFVDAVVNNHIETLENGYQLILQDDIAKFKLTSDGYYLVIHLVLPTKEWAEDYNSKNKGTSGHSLYYVDTTTSKLGKFTYTSNTEYVEDTEVTIKELIVIDNPSLNNLQKVYVNLFYVGFLEDCYIDYCKKVFEASMKHCRPNCTPKNSDEDKYARDFLLATKHVLEYLVEFDLYLEALRILEEINYCGGFCKNARQENSSGCGCASVKRSCGCR